MKASLFQILSVFLLTGSLDAFAVIRYVYQSNSTPNPPYTSWNTAATNIQDAIDLATAGDQILVSNGVYQAGSRTTADGATNRVAITKSVGVWSVNGAAVTIISGSGIMRCSYLTDGATMSGFTLTNGNAMNGGGAYCTSTNAQLLDCELKGNLGKYGGGVNSGTLSNCTISGNSVVFSGSGGGAYYSTLLNCTITGNSTTVNGGSGAGAVGGFLANCTINNNTCNGSGATVGGGVSGSVLTNCTLSGNRVIGAGSAGGGAYYSTLLNCTLSNNRSDFHAGGAYNCNLTNCTVVGNQASSGGGVSGGTLVNCILRNNSAYSDGGGVFWTTTLINCTLAGNSAQRGGGGFSCTFYNCIIYYNSAGNGPNTYACGYEFCCTSDSGGTGNITNAPLFVNQGAGDFRLQTGSGGIDAGTNGYAGSLLDLDGNLRIANGTVDMGAYEYQKPNPATVSIQCDYTNVVVGITASFKGIFSRGKTVSWNFGDGTVVSNQVFVFHSWAAPGDYPVMLTTYDSSNPGGVTGVYVIHVIPPPLAFVNPASTNPVPPYLSWQTAATNIQDAVDAVIYGTHILVTNGNYQSGGRAKYGALTNRLTIDKPVVVQSVNGPNFTTIQGNPVIDDTAVRCVYLTNGATLTGFTLRNGATRATGDQSKERSGGGAWCESTNATISNCYFISNAANFWGGAIRGGSLTNCAMVANATAAGSGGAAYSSLLQGCLISNNTAIIAYGGMSGGGISSCTAIGCTLVSNVTASPYAFEGWGGGAVDSTLIDCTLRGNSGKQGGAAYNCKLTNCTLTHNTAADSGGGADSSTLTSCLVVSNSAYSVGGGCYGGSGTNCVVQGNTSAYQGGGACGTYLINCLIAGNAGSVGGGTAGTPGGVGCTLVNCTVVGNSAWFRCGGTANSTAWNSIIVSNAGPEPSDWFGSILNYCCSSPLPDTGVGNITNAPLFVDELGGDFRLQSSSSCINAGTNAYALLGADLDANPRIIAGTVDLGAYESQTPALLAYFTWAQNFGLPTTASATYADSDADGMNNYGEWRSDTNPTNVLSVLRIAGVTNGSGGASVTWQSVASRSYWIERATNLSVAPFFQTIATNLPGATGLRTYVDPNATNQSAALYRVGVQ